MRMARWHLEFDDGEVDVYLYTKAVDIVINQQKVSTSYIQRYLQIGYNRAARIVEKMEEEGLYRRQTMLEKDKFLEKTNYLIFFNYYLFFLKV